MEFITIKHDESLLTILDFINKDSETFITETLNYLFINEWITDGSEEWQRTISEILDSERVDFLGVAILSLKTNQPNIIEAFANLTIVGKGDCPECGDELEFDRDGNGIDEWQINSCKFCGYQHSTEPVYDESYED